MANRVADESALLTIPRARRGAPSIALNSKVTKKFTVLGIDPGLDRTGYAVLETTTRRVVEAGLVRSSTKLTLARRLREIEAGLEEILNEHPVDLVAVEELYAHYKHPRTAILMGHARGVVLLAAARRGIEVMSLPATHVKRSLTGNGHASKLQMQRAILATMELNAMPEPPDVADAVAIAWCGGETVKSRKVEKSKH